MNNKIDWKRKLTSRKWWTSIASFVSLMIIACGGSDDTAVQVVSIIMAGATVIAYTIGEGLADAWNNNTIELAEAIDYSDCEEEK